MNERDDLSLRSAPEAADGSPRRWVWALVAAVLVILVAWSIQKARSHRPQDSTAIVEDAAPMPTNQSSAVLRRLSGQEHLPPSPPAPSNGTTTIITDPAQAERLAQMEAELARYKNAQQQQQTEPQTP